MAKFIEIHERGKPHTINVDAIEFFHPTTYWKDAEHIKEPATKIYFTNSNNIGDSADFLLAEEEYEKIKEMVCGNLND